MSYDGGIQMPDPDSGELTYLVSFDNYTSNVSPMWRAAMHAVTGEEMRLQDTAGWTAERAYPVLVQAAQWMREHAAQLEAMNPANGWGDYAGALRYMEHVAEHCRMNRQIPGAVLHWWC